MGLVLNGFSSIITSKAPRINLSSFGYTNQDYDVLTSVNSPMIYQIRWGASLGNINNLSTENELVDGDLVNVIWDVYVGNVWGESAVISSDNMVKVASLRKSRDIPFVREAGINPLYDASNNYITYHTFTVDLQSILKDYVDYTLVPIGKGAASDGNTLNSEYTTDNVNDQLNSGRSFRFVDVKCRFEVKSGESLVLAETTTTSGVVRGRGFTQTGIINNVFQWEDNWDELRFYSITSSNQGNKKFFSRCPNGDGGFHGYTDTEPIIYKSVRMDEEAEWLSWYLYSFHKDSTTGVFDTLDFYLKIITFIDGVPENTANLRSFKDDTMGGSYGSDIYPKRYLFQNVSPAFINGHTASTITSSTTTYTAQLFVNSTEDASHRTSETRYYKVDRESSKPSYDFVRFHWLNRMGGIDSYTAKRDISESISINKTFFERKSPNKHFITQAGVVGDSLGGDNYKSSIETYNINSTRSNSVYTEPLSTMEAKWLEEIFTSPNVWIEMENHASRIANQLNPTSRPSTKDYFPIIINNSSVETVNQENGLVKFNIEYTHSHKINTQSN